MIEMQVLMTKEVLGKKWRTFFLWHRAPVINSKIGVIKCDQAL